MIQVEDVLQIMNRRNREFGHSADKALLIQEAERQMRIRVKWMLGLGIAVSLNILAIIPFFKGHSLHARFGGVENYLLPLCGFLWSLFVGTTLYVYIWWQYMRKLRKIKD